MKNPDLTEEMNQTLASLRAIIAGLRGELERAERERDELRAALLPFANQDYSDVEALLTARKLCGLPDLLSPAQAVAELRKTAGHYFDGLDVDAFIQELREPPSAAAGGAEVV